MNSQDVFEGLDTLMDSFIGGNLAIKKLVTLLTNLFLAETLTFWIFFMNILKMGLKIKMVTESNFV